MGQPAERAQLAARRAAFAMADGHAGEAGRTAAGPRGGVRATSAAAALCALSACDEMPAPSPPPAAVPVAVHEMRAESIRPTIRAFGVVEALEAVDINIDFTGVVRRVHVDVGDRVAAGELLAELDRSKLSLNLRRAEQAAVQAVAALAEARRNLRRRERLARERTITEEELDRARSALDARLASQRQAQAQAALAARELADSAVRAPVAGVIDARAVAVGETVLAGEPLFRLQAVDGLRVLVWVSEVQVNALRVGDTATVSFRAWPAATTVARIDSIGIDADPRTGNYPVRLLLPKTVAGLRPGMTASARIEGLAMASVYRLPEAALVDRHRRKVVYVVRDGVAVETVPRLAAGFSDQLLALSGLGDGDLVIVSNLARVIDGAEVVVRPASGR